MSMDESTQINTNFAGALRHIRASHGISLRETARLVGAAPESIRLWETAERTPAKGMRRRLIKFLTKCRDLNPAVLTLEVASSFIRAAYPNRPLDRAEQAEIFGDVIGQPPNALSGVRVGESAVSPSIFRAREADVGLVALRYMPTLHSGLQNRTENLGTLYGRTHELEEVKQKIRQARVQLITLVGAPGCGKSRLALHLAAEISSEFKNGVCLVDLSTLNNPELLEYKVAAALGIMEESGRALSETLITYLQESSLLIILDGCEHMAEVCAEFVEKLLDKAPFVKILATSVELLGLSREFVKKIEPLPVPNNAADAGDLARNECVRLFISKSQNPWLWHTSEQIAGAIAGICRRVNGIPLAVELVAGHADTFSNSPVRIEHKLEQDFQRQTGGSSAGLAKPLTLRTTINWSYRRLEADPRYEKNDRLLFRQISVFPGSFTLNAAESIFNVSPGSSELASGYVVSKGLARLVEAALLTEKHQGGDRRFLMHDAIRRFAREKLGEERGEARRTERMFRTWCLKLVQSAEAAFVGSDRDRWLDRLEIEIDNLRAALSLALTQGNKLRACELSAPLSVFWYLRGQYGEGRRWLEAALSLTNEPMNEVAVAKALCGAGMLAHAQASRALPGDENLSEAREHLKASQAMWQTLQAEDRLDSNETWYFAFTLALFGLTEIDMGNYLAGEQHENDALKMLDLWEDNYQNTNSRTSIIKWCRALVFANLGMACLIQENYPEARDFFETSRKLFKELEDAWGLGLMLFDLGLTARFEKDYQKARYYLGEGLLIARKLGDWRNIAKSLFQLGYIAHELGQYDDALEYFSNCLALYVKLDRHIDVLRSAEAITVVLHDLGRTSDVVRLLRAIPYFPNRSDFKGESEGAATEYPDRVEKIRAALGEQQPSVEETTGRLSPLQQVVADILLSRY